MTLKVVIETSGRFPDNEPDLEIHKGLHDGQIRVSLVHSDGSGHSVTVEKGDLQRALSAI